MNLSEYVFFYHIVYFSVHIDVSVSFLCYWASTFSFNSSSSIYYLQRAVFFKLNPFLSFHQLLRGVFLCLLHFLESGTEERGSRTLYFSSSTLNTTPFISDASLPYIVVVEGRTLFKEQITGRRKETDSSSLQMEGIDWSRFGLWDTHQHMPNKLVCWHAQTHKTTTKEDTRADRYWLFCPLLDKMWGHLRWSLILSGCHMMIQKHNHKPP